MDYTNADTSAHSQERNNQNTEEYFSDDEKKLITRMYKLVGERWSLIAGRIPGRTAEQIEKYWTSRNSGTTN
ncbi:Myb-like transcription factor etc1 [Thalictrum thalictroides]|uniref:Myb-like transcription factor etc1 n=1 Tax=Thalictrum thalictroides TaxID=46969 RepID=A0A7J6W9F5_THATH|nr:Myb-like transcription factor etc1 [Thalictrum thalictroides]